MRYMKNNLLLRSSLKPVFSTIMGILFCGVVIRFAYSDDIGTTFSFLVFGVGFAILISLIFTGYSIELADGELISKYLIFPLKSLQIDEIERIDREQFMIYGSVHRSWIFTSKNKRIRVGEFAGYDNTLKFVRAVLDKNPRINLPGQYVNIRTLPVDEALLYIQKLEVGGKTRVFAGILLGIIFLVLSLLIAHL